MPQVYVIPKDRRKGDQGGHQVDQERRNPKNSFLPLSEVKSAIEYSKWEETTLIQFINNKEQKKLMVTNVSFALFTVLTGMVASIIAIIGKQQLDSEVRYSLYVSLLVVLLGANFINITVIKYIASLKSEIMMALRQLNCTRQSLLSFVYAELEGKFPSPNFRYDKGESDSATTRNVFWNYIGQHVKFPIDNDRLRDVYFKEGKNGEYVYDYKALIRSADLFSMLIIMLFTAMLTLAPLLLYGYLHYQQHAAKGTFDQGMWFSLISLGIVLVSSYGFWRIVKSFFGRVVQPLRPEP